MGFLYREDKRVAFKSGMVKPTLTPPRRASLPFVRERAAPHFPLPLERVGVRAIRCRRARPTDHLSPSPGSFPKDREGVARGSSLY
jgi:hypothetical protein